MEHKQGVTRLCENLASIIDRFEWLGEASRNNSYEMFRMFVDTAEGEGAGGPDYCTQAIRHVL